MTKLFRKLFALLPFLPLTFFMFYARVNHFTDLAWHNAFIISSVIAIIQFGVFLAVKLPFHRFMLAVNLFLCVGGFAFLFNIEQLLSFYSQFKATVLFLCLFIVGMATTLMSHKGFIDVDSSDKAKIKRSSYTLLAGTLVAIIVSYIAKSSFLLSGGFPFIALLILRHYLIQRLDKSSQLITD